MVLLSGQDARRAGGSITQSNNKEAIKSLENSASWFVAGG
jgi:hypothetical protein